MRVEIREGLTERRETQDVGVPPTAMGWDRPELVDPSDMDPDERRS
jgi:hypothetical protein